MWVTWVEPAVSAVTKKVYLIHVCIHKNFISEYMSEGKKNNKKYFGTEFFNYFSLVH